MNIILKKKRKVTKKINAQEISIKPYIDTSEKQTIISNVLESFAKSVENGDDFIRIVCEARANYDALVAILVTDVEITKEDSYDDMLSSGLIDLVRESVFNYQEVYDDMMFILSSYKNNYEIQRLGSVEDVFDKLNAALDSLTEEQKSRLEIFSNAAMASATIKPPENKPVNN